LLLTQQGPLLWRFIVIRSKYHAEIERAIAQAKATRDDVSITLSDGAQVYAYSPNSDRINWGVNAPRTGVNILRGIRLANGKDIGVM
jgi:hypothetical protein